MRDRIFVFFVRYCFRITGYRLPQKADVPRGCLDAMTWAKRLKRAFRSDVEVCPVRGGAMRIISRIEEADVVDKLEPSG